MTFQRDLAWEHLGARYKASLTYSFARYALALKYDLIPQNVIHQAKRCLMDALASNIGGYAAPGRPMLEDASKEIGGKEESTVVGSGMRTSMMNATLINSFMTRFPENNDSGGGGHNNESVPAVLAVAEAQKTSGRETLASIVCSYELGARVQESFHASGVTFGERGIGHDTRGGLSMPPTLGRLMGLNVEQLANAIACTASGNILLNCIDADREENTMRKNLRLGAISHASILYCLLGKRGFTGPLRVVEGEDGWNQVLAQNTMDLDKLVDFSGWRILKVKNKLLWSGGMLHGHLFATLALAKEHKIKPEQVEAVRIRVGGYGGKHNTPLVKKYPRNSESADHSSYFLTAIAIMEGAVGLNSADPKKFTDPTVLDLIERVTVEVDPNIPHRSRGGISEITLKDGRVLTKETVTPHGYDEKSLLSDKELEDKLREEALPYMKKDRIAKIIDTVWGLDKLDNISPLMKLTVF